MLNLLKAQPTTKGFKVSIVGVRQSLREIHARTASNLDGSVTADHPFAESGKSYCKLDGRTRLRSL